MTQAFAPLLKKSAHPRIVNVSSGAAGIVWAAALPDDGPTGGFFRDEAPLDW